MQNERTHKHAEDHPHLRLFAENMHAENPLRMRLFAENRLLSSKTIPLFWVTSCAPTPPVDRGI